MLRRDAGTRLVVGSSGMCISARYSGHEVGSAVELLIQDYPVMRHARVSQYGSVFAAQRSPRARIQRNTWSSSRSILVRSKRFGEMSLPEGDRRSHLLLVVIALVDADDAGADAAHMVEQRLGHIEPYAEAL